MTRRRGVLAALTAAAIVLVAGRALATLRVDYAWYAALGLPSLARTNLAGALFLRGGTTLLATLFLFANLYAVRRSIVSLVLPRRVGDLEFGEEVPGRYLVGTVAIVAIAVGSLLGIDGTHWPRIVLGLEGVTFGERDPYLDNDIGFYVGWLPAELLLFTWAQRLLIATAFVTVLLYAMTPSIRWRGRTLYVSEYVRRHLTVLGGVLLLVFAWAFRLESYQLLMDGSGPGGAFTAIDLQLRAPGALVLAATSLAAGLLVIWAGFAGQVRLAFFAVSVMLLLSVVVRFLLPAALRPGGDPGRADRPFLQTREGFTRRAFGADLVARDSTANAGAITVRSVRDVAVWDAPALRRAIDGAAGLGWTTSPTGIQAIVAQRGFVEGGEMTPWTVSRVAAWTADPAGEPVTSRAPYGERTELLAPIVVADTAPGYRIISDPGGIVAGADATSWSTRLVHAWALQNFRILLGALPSQAPTIVLRPQLHQRIAAVAPFFLQGDIPRPAVAGDTLYWVVELYTGSDTYPLSEPLTFVGADRRYFHPAGHAVVNSATGRVRVVPLGANEPVLRVWMRRFPALFVTARSLPSGVADALGPHIETARARALTFARLGPTAREAPAERRHLVIEHGADSVVAADPPPMVLGGSLGLSVVVPVLDARDRVAGVVVTSSDNASRWISARDQRPWGEVIDALRAADSTDGRRDARPVRGRVRVIPVQGDLVFAQPTFLWPARGGPTLASVSTLTPAGVRSAGGLQLQPLPAGTPAPAEERPGARSVYLRMRDALRRGEWAAFGALLDTLGQALDARPR